VISSSYCELVFRDASTALARSRGAAGAAGAASRAATPRETRIAVESWEIPAEFPERPEVRANRPVELTLRRGPTNALLRVRVEADELMRLTRDRDEWTVQLTESLRDQYGLADLVVEEASADDPDVWSPVLSLTLSITAEAAFERLHEALVRELEDVHLALARDVVSRTWRPRGARGSNDVRSFRPEDDVSKLDEIHARLERALDRIGEQPSRSLYRTRVVGRWRPGDRVSSHAAHRMVVTGEIRRGADGRIAAPTRALVDRPRLATDIEEHRHLRSGILRLAERSASLARYCSRAIDLLEEDQVRWSGPAFEQRTRPRVESLDAIRSSSEDLQCRFRRLVERLPFLRDAGPPRTKLHPTPVFLGRPAYRDAYRALVEARQHAGGRFDASGLRARFRNLATLYEYWVFVKTVGLLREICGPPDGDGAFTLIDEVYRPELAPGQQFHFRLSRGDTLTATYEPDFPPLAARGPRRGYYAAMVSAPLRPDVTIELSVPHRPPAILALDAKSGPRFTRPQERLQEASRYLWLVHDPTNGHQPIRQLFLVHRDRDTAPISNVPGYLEARVSPADARILGAVPAQPGETDHLRNVILRFLETFRSRRRR